MLERVAIVILLAALGVGAYTVGTRWQVRRTGHRADDSATAALLARLRPGVPAVIYFWSESCPPCKTVQKPALEQLQAALGPDGVQVVAIDALERPDLAAEWGVLGLPTTFIVDGLGRPRCVNHGVARAAQLQKQIEAVSIST